MENFPLYINHFGVPPFMETPIWNMILCKNNGIGASTSVWWQWLQFKLSIPIYCHDTQKKVALNWWSCRSCYVMAISPLYWLFWDFPFSIWSCFGTAIRCHCFEHHPGITATSASMDHEQRWLNLHCIWMHMGWTAQQVLCWYVLICPDIKHWWLFCRVCFFSSPVTLRWNMTSVSYSSDPTCANKKWTAYGLWSNEKWWTVV